MPRDIVQATRSIAKALRCRYRRGCFQAQVPFRRVLRCSTLILAPHPDDETLGCGGLICLKRSLGSDVHVVFLTRGEGALRGHSDSPLADVAEARTEQTRQACRCLGVEDSCLHWLELKDGAIPRAGEDGFSRAVSRLVHLMGQCQVVEVVAPSPADAFPDHEAASEIASAAFEEVGGKVRLLHYVVWGWYNAPWGMRQFPWKQAWRLDISSALPTKRAAIRCYLEPHEPSSGLPYVGKLPRTLMACAMQRDEVYFDG